jgi:SPP1 gp7 family putative phage head morphogenesis protein
MIALVRLDKVANAAAIKARAAKLAKAGKKQKIVRPLFPTKAELAYSSAMKRKVLSVANELVVERVLPAMDDIIAAAQELTKADAAGVHRADDYARIITDIFGDIRIEFEKRTTKTIRAVAEEAGEDTAETNKKDQQRVFKSLLGLDVIGKEPWLKDFVQLFTESNVGLIKSIPDKFFGEIESMVREAAVTGLRPEDFADDIEERFGVSESKARLLARDQVSKFNGELTRIRQGRLGIISYFWRSSKDERVRESHAAQEGQEYKWDDPPSETGHPGQDYQCRCTAEPNIENLNEEETLDAADVIPIFALRYARLVAHTRDMIDHPRWRRAA